MFRHLQRHGGWDLVARDRFDLSKRCVLAPQKTAVRDDSDSGAEWDPRQRASEKAKGIANS
eukprot:12404159-Alexandrium_andersonii.AAC.1